jgi:enamine deaminase RidA (YjgF/YER057c/UK114 family)
MDIEQRLSDLGIELPPFPVPVASYVPVKIAGGFAFVAGQIARVDGAVVHPGRLGAEVSVEQGQEAARLCALQALSALRDALGGFERLLQIARVEVFVASIEGFEGQPMVANGVSDVLAEILGDAGVHARAAVGVVALPLGASVEVTVIAEVSPAG